jgi:hypothetical protein
VMAREVLRIDKTPPMMRCRAGVGPGVLEHGRALTGVIDSASFADTGFGRRADAMNELGCTWETCDKSANSRLAGKAQIHARLAPKD